jgi:hypothetical protein
VSLIGEPFCKVAGKSGLEDFQVRGRQARRFGVLDHKSSATATGASSFASSGSIQSPHGGNGDAWGSALGAHRFAEADGARGAVGKYLTRPIRQRVWPSPAVVAVGGGNRNLFDKGGVGVSSHMGLEPVNGWLALVLDPTTAAAFRPRLCTGKAAEPPKGRTLIHRFGQLHIRRIVPNRQQQRLVPIRGRARLNIASGGQAASPLTLAWIGLSKSVIGCQSSLQQL